MCKHIHCDGIKYLVIYSLIHIEWSYDVNTKTDFLADTVEDKEIPSVTVTYTDKDIFRRTDSSATIDTKSVDINDELNASDEVWDERQKKAGEAGTELAEKLNEFFEQ